MLGHRVQAFPSITFCILEDALTAKRKFQYRRGMYERHVLHIAAVDNKGQSVKKTKYLRTK